MNTKPKGERQPVVVLTDPIRKGLEAMIALAGAEAIALPSTSKNKKKREELSRAISWINYQLARNERERERKRVSKRSVSSLAADIIVTPPPPTVEPAPAPPNTPPVKWPKYRISDLTDAEKAVKEKSA